MKLTIYSDLNDPYAKYGLAHFVNRFELINSNEKDAEIYIGYTEQQDSHARIQIILNTNNKDGFYYLKTLTETIPIFIKPAKTDGELIFGTIQNNSEKYTCITIHQNRIIVGFDIFQEIGKIIAGLYDSKFLQKDELGVKLRTVPVVDLLEDTLFSAFNNILPDSIHHFIWPENHKFALVLTHDVDRVYKTYQYLPSLLNSIKKAHLSELWYHLNNLLTKHGENNPYWTFENICKLENTLGVKSTYYFLNERGKPKPFNFKSWILFRGVYNIERLQLVNAIRKLAEAGFEIGLHGSYHSYNNIELLKYEKQILESIIGSKIKGIRQHYLNYDTTITPNIHYKCGFGYDTSVGFNPKTGLGFRRGTSFPFKTMLTDLSVSPLLEIPLIIMDGVMDTTATFEDCLKLVDQVEKHNGVLTILWHTQRFNRREYPGMADLYERLITKAKNSNAWITTANEVCEWLNTKERK